MQRIDGKNIWVIVTTDQLEALERVQKRHGMNRSEAIRACLDLGLDVYADFEKAGIPQFVEVGKKVKSAIKDYFQPRLV